MARTTGRVESGAWRYTDEVRRSTGEGREAERGMLGQVGGRRLAREESGQRTAKGSYRLPSPPPAILPHTITTRKTLPVSTLPSCPLNLTSASLTPALSFPFVVLLS